MSPEHIGLILYTFIVLICPFLIVALCLDRGPSHWLSFGCALVLTMLWTPLAIHYLEVVDVLA